MRPSYSNQAAEAILRVQGEPVLINGVTTTAVVVRHVSADGYSSVSKYKLSPNLALLKVSGEPDTFNNAQVVFDDTEWIVTEAKTGKFRLCDLTVRRK